MALGGGTFIAQNKILPGSYINFVAASRASAALSDRGIVAMPLTMSWGPEGEVFEVSKDDFVKNSVKIFGYAYTADEMIGMRELFKNAKTGLFFRLGTGATEASNDYAKAKYKGERGKLISIRIKENDAKFDVETLFDGNVVDIQKSISAITELENNDFVEWKTDWPLAATPVTPDVGVVLRTGGTDATTSNNYEVFLNKIESYAFHTLAVADQTANSLFEDFTKTMREDRGVKFQTVLHKSTANHEGIISVGNDLIGATDSSAIIYWVAGAEAGCNVNKTLSNRTYDGELQINVDFTQKQLENSISDGKFLFHRVGSDVRVLEDINTLTKYPEGKNPDFSDNQVIRVLDQIGNDIAALFNDRYLAKTPNDESGRVGLWSDIVAHHRQLESLRAIEDFESEHVTVEKGEGKKSVVVTDIVTPVCAMTKLYMTIVVE